MINKECRDCLEQHIEIIKLKKALQSFVHAHERALNEQGLVRFTQEELERIKLIQPLI